MTRALSRFVVPAIIAGSLTTAAPALAHHGGGGPQGPPGAANARSVVPSRVTSRVQRAEKALQPRR